MNHDSGLKLFGVIGHPIRHTLSPLMHNTAFEALGMHCVMQGLDIKPDSLVEALHGFRAMEFGGINVTIPHKERIIPLLDQIDHEARMIGAVNTVQFSDGKLTGYNTDAHGFEQSISPVRLSIKDSVCLVLGAGGAAKAVVYVLLKHFQARQIIVVSRSLTRAKDLADHFKEINGNRLSVLRFDDPSFLKIVAGSRFIVNATPIGMYPNIDASPIPSDTLRQGQVVADLIYRPLKTKLITEADEAGAQTVIGLEMLLHQGSRSFSIWTGREMDINLVRKALVKKLREEQVLPPRM
jgi:shikimate dehydrogenase